MTVKEKRKALEEHCYFQSKNCTACALYDAGEERCGISGSDFADFTDELIDEMYAKVFPETPEPCGDMDYEAEYHKLRDETAKLREELKYMQMNARELRENDNILRAKLDMVYLIFGGRNR